MCTDHKPAEKSNVSYSHMVAGRQMEKEPAGDSSEIGKVSRQVSNVPQLAFCSLSQLGLFCKDRGNHIKPYNEPTTNYIQTCSEQSFSNAIVCIRIGPIFKRLRMCFSSRTRCGSVWLHPHWSSNWCRVKALSSR